MAEFLRLMIVFGGGAVFGAAYRGIKHGIYQSSIELEKLDLEIAKAVKKKRLQEIQFETDAVIQRRIGQ